MSMREEVLKLAKECGASVGCNMAVYRGEPITNLLERFYQAAYLAGAKAMQEEAAKVCDELAATISLHPIDCAFSIRAINPESLGGV